MNDDNQEKDTDPMDEELTLRAIAKEFHLNLGTLRNWVSDGLVTTRKQTSELGVDYHVVKRSEITKVLQNRRKVGRPLRRA